MGSNIANLCAGGYNAGKSNKIPFFKAGKGLIFLVGGAIESIHIHMERLTSGGVNNRRKTR